MLMYAGHFNFFGEFFWEALISYQPAAPDTQHMLTRKSTYFYFRCTFEQNYTQFCISERGWVLSSGVGVKEAVSY